MVAEGTADAAARIKAHKQTNLLHNKVLDAVALLLRQSLPPVSAQMCMDGHRYEMAGHVVAAAE